MAEHELEPLGGTSELWPPKNIAASSLAHVSELRSASWGSLFVSILGCSKTFVGIFFHSKGKDQHALKAFLLSLLQIHSLVSLSPPQV